MVITLNKPKSPLSITRREHKDLLDRLAPESQTRVRCCAAQLIAYFQHWHSWKKPRYPSDWIYQPLTEIRHDLMDAFTIHVIRDAIAVLQRLGFLSVRKNDRAINWRNGQDKTHQYYLHSDRIEAALENRFKVVPTCEMFANNQDRIEAALENRFKEPTAETREKSPFVNSEMPDVNSEMLDVTDDTHTQIPYTNSCTDSKSLFEEREEFKSQPTEEDIGISQNKLNDVKEEIEQNKELLEDEKAQESCDNINPGGEQCSAAIEVKCVESTQNERVESTQNDIKPKPKLKSDRVSLVPSAERASGFVSNEERQGFYQVLLELGKTKGVRSPVAWSAAIIKSIDNGDPCQYLTEYREGLLVGAIEKQEWEIAPGQPYEQFVTYLKTKNKKTGMTDEEAIAAAHHFLKDVNLAKSLWESCKRAIAKYQEDWEQQKRLGVQNAYLPPELLPERHVSLEEVADAMESLQAGCGQLQGLTESTQNSAKLPTEPEEAEAELEEALELSSEPTPELGSVGESEPEEKPEIDVSVVKAQAAQMREHLRSASAMKATVGRAWVRAHEPYLIVQRDGGGQIIDFQLVEEVGDGVRELSDGA